MQKAEPWNRSVLGVAAAVEVVTGLALMVAPQVVARLLFGVEVTGVALVIGRVTGIALLSLGLGCWLGGTRPMAQARRCRRCSPTMPW
jgi:hypothetical protein